MTATLSYCGLLCKNCPIYLATREPDIEEQRRQRIEIARMCREQHGLNFELSDITDCDGCRAEGGRLFKGCAECAIRTCARSREIDNCALCPEYVCDKLNAFFVKEPSARTCLDEVRRTAT